MRAYPPPPIFGVPIIRLAPMHHGVNKTAVRVLDTLGDLVGSVQMVVPEQEQRPDEILLRGGQLGFTKKRVKFGDEGGFSKYPGTGFGPERRRLWRG